MTMQRRGPRCSATTTEKNLAAIEPPIKPLSCSVIPDLDAPSPGELAPVLVSAPFAHTLPSPLLSVMHGRGGALPLAARRHLGRDLRALDHRLELGVHDVCGDVHGPGGGGEAAVGARQDALRANEADVVHEPLGDEPRVLDVARGRVQHPGHDDLARRQLGGLEDFPLVAMAWVARLHAQVLRLGDEHDVDDVGERHVVVVGPRVVAPADVHTHALGRDVRHRLVHDPHGGLRRLLELRERPVLELRVAAHAEVGAVDLKREAGGVDGVVLPLHRPA
mmetsp:Transcript_118125/g.335090  ORF Transcript_118125/g.335090 Transcript_118125/m.335090 type:complete len:278 (-) Transcript_118125:532-1365(-)